MNVNQRDADGQTPLHKAVVKDEKRIIHLLLEYRAKLSIRDYQGLTALDIAAERNLPHIIRMMVEAALESKDIEGSTPLHKESFFGHRDDFRGLLSQHADPNAIDVYNATPLHYAIFSRDSVIIWLLIEAGADVNVQSKHWGTALHKAAYAGLAEAVKLLLDTGADINAIRALGRWTPIGLALRGGNLTVASIIMYHPAFDWPVRDEYETFVENDWELVVVKDFLCRPAVWD